MTDPDGSIVLPDGGEMMDPDGGGGTDGGEMMDPDSGGPVSCDNVGVGCTPDRGCASGECQDTLAGDLGGADDPITGHPDGEDTVEMISDLPGGYCTPSAINFVDSGGCDPDVETSCGECATCLGLGQQEGRTLSMCFKDCTPSMTENTCPQDTEQCLLGTNVCLWGCSSDDLCAINREDTNGNGEIDPYDPTMNPEGDNLVYDTAGNWTCNMTTRRCEHEAPEGASGGDACVRDSECENYGRCLDEMSFEDFAGGYCIKSGCDVAGNECGGTGVCDDRAFGFPVCLAPCEVGSSDVTDDPETTDVDESRFGGPPDCREGYGCFWNGTDGAGADNGVCVPGEFNDVRTPNVGTACTDESTCYSPYGKARCLDWDGDEGPVGSTCTLTDCAAPGLPTDVCGDNAACISLGTSFTACLQTCADASECADGYACLAASEGGPTVCLWGCQMDGDCRTGETCMGASSSSLGECVAGS